MAIRIFGKPLLAGAVLSLGLSLAGTDLRADDYQDGVKAYNDHDFTGALAHWMPLAQDGDARAQYSLGKLFETGGEGLPVDRPQALEWYGKAAEQGIAAAFNNLGLMHAQDGKPTQAAEFWKKAAERNHPMGQYNLALAFFRGEGVSEDQGQAVFWFHQAAKSGVSGAQFALGEVYRHGLSVGQDYGIAQKWYSAALEQGYGPAREGLDALAKDVAEEKAEIASRQAVKPSPAAKNSRESPQEEEVVALSTSQKPQQSAGDLDGDKAKGGIKASKSDQWPTSLVKPQRNPRRITLVDRVRRGEVLKRNPRRS